MCGTRCVTMNAWCSGGSFPCANLGAGITSDSEIICNNHTLWRNISCYNYVGPGTRCSGLKQCAYPTTSLYRLVSRDCSDNSTSIHIQGAQCPAIPTNTSSDYEHCGWVCNGGEASPGFCLRCLDPRSCYKSSSCAQGLDISACR